MDFNKKQWQRLIEGSHEPAFIHDEEGRVVHANRAYKRIAEASMEAIIHQPYWNFFPKGEGSLAGCCLADKGDEDVIIPFKDMLGRSFLSHSRNIKSDNDNTHHYAIHFIQDVSSQQQALQSLELTSHKLRQALEGSIRAIATTVEMRDPYTAGHQRRVGDLGRAIAKKIGLDEHQQEGIYFGGIIHDIGKIHVPAEILSWPNKLSPCQYALVQEHPTIGYHILQDIEFPWPIADIAHQHHERIDGSGYPQGLTGVEICLEARIVAVADTVEAITMRRPYRDGRGIEAGLSCVVQGMNSSYDIVAVDACVELFHSNEYSLEMQ